MENKSILRLDPPPTPPNLTIIEQRGEKGEIPKSVAREILNDDPRRFYGL